MGLKWWLKMIGNALIFMGALLIGSYIFRNYEQLQSNYPQMTYGLLAIAALYGGYLIIQALYWKDLSRRKKAEHKLKNLEQMVSAQSLQIRRLDRQIMYLREASVLISHIKAYFDTNYVNAKWDIGDDGKVIDPEYYILSDLQMIQHLISKADMDTSKQPHEYWREQ